MQQPQAINWHTRATSLGHHQSALSSLTWPKPHWPHFLLPLLPIPTISKRQRGEEMCRGDAVGCHMHPIQALPLRVPSAILKLWVREEEDGDSRKQGRGRGTAWASGAGCHVTGGANNFPGCSKMCGRVSGPTLGGASKTGMENQNGCTVNAHSGLHSSG